MESDAPVVVLSGASSGIGEALALTYARLRGARLGLIARREEELRRVGAAVEEAGGEALVLPCDVVDGGAVAEAVAEVRARFGRVDLAIANAGVGDPTPAVELDAARFAQVLRVNAEGTINLFAAALPGMVERGDGHLVAVSSIAAWRGLPRSAAYSASKAAVSTALESLRPELRAAGVAVTAVHPGFVRTPLTDKNRFTMPFRMEVEDAAALMVRGLARRPRELNFPWQLVWAMTLARWMPGWLFDRAVGGGPLAKEARRF